MMEELFRAEARGSRSDVDGLGLAGGCLGYGPLHNAGLNPYF